MSQFKENTCETCLHYEWMGADSDQNCYRCKHYGDARNTECWTSTEWFKEIEQLNNTIEMIRHLWNLGSAYEDELECALNALNIDENGHRK